VKARETQTAISERVRVRLSLTSQMVYVSISENILENMLHPTFLHDGRHMAVEHDGRLHDCRQSTVERRRRGLPIPALARMRRTEERDTTIPSRSANISVKCC
jgi:hypothetical protein